MRKLFVVSDVHSFYDEMMKALEEAGFDKYNPEHTFVSCGDLLDRGPKPLECLRFVNSLPADRKILILGNHEDLAIEATIKKRFESRDEHNGTIDTMYTVTGCNRKTQLDANGLPVSNLEVIRRFYEHPEWQAYISSCRDFYENDKYVFVHGWLPLTITDAPSNWSKFAYGFTPQYEYDPGWQYGDWEAARWYNGFKMWHRGLNQSDRTVVCGHYHTSFAHSLYHNDGIQYPYSAYTDWELSQLSDEQIEYILNHEAKFTPFIDKGIIGLDACTVISGFVNCIVLLEEE